MIGGQGPASGTLPVSRHPPIIHHLKYQAEYDAVEAGNLFFWNSLGNVFEPGFYYVMTYH